MNKDESREAFEKWASGQTGFDFDRFVDESPRKIAWAAWQAAQSNVAAQVPSESRPAIERGEEPVAATPDAPELPPLPQPTILPFCIAEVYQSGADGLFSSRQMYDYALKVSEASEARAQRAEQALRELMEDASRLFIAAMDVIYAVENSLPHAKELDRLRDATVAHTHPPGPLLVQS